MESVEPPDPSLADDVPQEDAVLVFDVRRAAVSVLFQVHRLKVLVEAGLVASSSACFEFANEVPKEAQHGSLAALHSSAELYYRKYRSLGTPPRLTFQVRLLHNQEDVNTELYV